MEERRLGPLRVFVEELPYLESETVSLWVGAGSAHDGPGESGTAHFLEHLLFKGTGRRSARDLAEEVEAVGGYLNGFTEPELTCYQIRVPARHSALALDLLFDLTRNPRLDPEDFGKERRVILDEIALVGDEPEERVFELLAGAVFGEHPLGLPITGRRADVAGLGLGSLERFFHRYYRLAGMVLTAVGPVSAAEILRESERLLGPVSDESVPERVLPPFHFVGGQRRENRATEQLHLGLAGPGLAMAHPDRPALDILNLILGGGQSSRLFQRLREDEGLAYSVTSESVYHRMGGFLAVFATMEPAVLGRVLAVLKEEMARLRKEAVPGHELERAKEQLKGSLLLALEDPLARSDHLGRDALLLGRVEEPSDIRAAWERVTAEELRAVAERSLPGEGAALAAVGPVRGTVRW